jgi:pimeloyl-ACP methyl ester carboxylesterase
VRFFASILLVGGLVAVGDVPPVAAQSVASHANEPLPRRPFLGVLLAAADKLEVRSFLEKPVPGAELRIGDTIQQVNDQAVGDVTDILKIIKPLRVGDEVRLQIQRGEGRQMVKWRLPAWPKEAPAGFDVLYDEVRSTNKALRCLVTRPAAASHGKVPALLYIQGIDGATIESPFPGPSHMRDFVYGLTPKGFAVMRCEKSGVGDSTGVPCEELGLAEEVSDFAAALRRLKQFEFVDPERVFLFGHSAGGWVAPIVATKEPVAGITVYGTVVRTFGEYLVENHRRNKWHRAHPDPAELELEVRRMTRLWRLLLDERQEPEQVLKSAPELKDVVEHVFRGRAGLPYDVRSLGYFRDVHQQNMAAVWGQLRVPVLALIGQYEVRCAPFEHEYIADIVNFHVPGKGTWKILPRLDHGFAEHDSMQDAVSNEFQGPFGKVVVSETAAWMRKVLDGASNKD